MATPSNYKTLRGLLKATERVLEARQRGISRQDGMSVAMWITNAEYAAVTNFRDGKSVQDLRAKYAVTRPPGPSGRPFFIWGRTANA